MKPFDMYLSEIKKDAHKARMLEILQWIIIEFPNLKGELKWNTPMFVKESTFIIGFSTSKQHISVSPEAYTIEKFSSDIKESDYSHTDNLFRIKWNQAINFPLLRKIIEFNITDKEGCTTFWRT